MSLFCLIFYFPRKFSSSSYHHRSSCRCRCCCCSAKKFDMVKNELWDGWPECGKSRELRVDGSRFFYILESFNKPTNVHCGGALMSSEEAGNEFHIFGTTRLDLTRPSGKEKTWSKLVRWSGAFVSSWIAHFRRWIENLWISWKV